MKIKDILNEEVTDLVARFYKESTKDAERQFNPEDVKYKGENHLYYEHYFKEFAENGTTPVFSTPVTPAQPEYTSLPKPGKLQSPGYRGLQYALARAGLPYRHDVQKYDPNAPAPVSSDMNGALNNNGN